MTATEVQSNMLVQFNMKGDSTKRDTLLAFCRFMADNEVFLSQLTVGPAGVFTAVVRSGKVVSSRRLHALTASSGFDIRVEEIID